MIKKILAVTLAAIFCLAVFASCGESGTSEGGTLVLGGIGPLTGGAASYGTGVMKGAQLAVNEINAARRR